MRSIHLHIFQEMRSIHLHIFQYNEKYTPTYISGQWEVYTYIYFTSTLVPCDVILHNELSRDALRRRLQLLPDTGVVGDMRSLVRLLLHMRKVILWREKGFYKSEVDGGFNLWELQEMSLSFSVSPQSGSKCFPSPQPFFNLSWLTTSAVKRWPLSGAISQIAY